MVRLKAGNDIIWRNELHFNIFGWRFRQPIAICDRIGAAVIVLSVDYIGN